MAFSFASSLFITPSFTGAKGYIFHHGLIRKKIEALKDHAHVLTDLVDIGLGSVMRFPSNQISPEVGSSRRFRHLRKVLFPEPEGPMMATFSPLSISVDILFSTSRSLKVLQRFLTDITASQPPLECLQQEGQYLDQYEIYDGCTYERHESLIGTA